MPVNGVRSSWLTLASSCDLAMLARSADSRAAFSLLMRTPAYSGTTVSRTMCETSNKGVSRQVGDRNETRPKPMIETTWHRCIAVRPTRKPKPRMVKR